MYGFIAFSFKMIFAAIVGGALNYIPGKESEQHKIIETSLICIFGASILGLVNQLSGNGSNFAIGFGILAVIIGTNFISKSLDFKNRIIWFFASASGMIIGLGFIFQAAILIALIYIILRNSETILNYLDRESDQSDDNVAENISK